MSRAVLAIMAGLLCALAGARHAATIKADAARLSRWIPLLQHLALLLREGTLSIPAALCAAAEAAHAPDKLLRDMAACLSNKPRMTPAEAFLQCSTASPETDTLHRMFQRLGRGSKDNRILAIEQAIDEVTLLAQSARDKAEKDVKLWQTLGITGGICLTILLM